MANELSDADPGPDVGPSPASFILANRRRSVATAISDLDANPDDAARAMQLSQATGVPAPIINADLPGFEHQHKAQLTAGLLDSNDYLRTFVDINPMAAKIANDDYANLDAVSQRVSGMSMPEKILRAPEALGQLMFPGDPLKRFTEGGPLGSWVMRDPKFVAENRFLAATVAGLGTPIELIFRGLGGAQMTAADAAANLVGSASPALGRDIGAMIEQAGLHGRKGLIEHPVFKATDQYFGGRTYLENGREPPPGVLPEYDAFRAERNAQDVEALGEVVKDAQASLVRERNPDLFRDFIARHTDAEIGLNGDAVVALYGDKVPMPDDGLLGWVPGIEDKLNLARASGDDVSVPLADWVAKVEPDVMKALSEDIRVRPGAITAREMVIAAEQAEDWRTSPLAALPENVASYIGDSNVQALPSGKLIHVDPETGERLRYTTGGTFKPSGDASVKMGSDKPLGSINDVEEHLGAPKTKPAQAGPRPPPLPEEVPTVRAASALEPLYSIGDRKLNLQRLVQEKSQFVGRDPHELAANDGLAWNDLAPHEKQRYEDLTKGTQFGPEQGFHDFSLMDEKGNLVGTINLSLQRGGKDIYVEMINGVNGLGPRDFGPALMRDLRKQLKVEFPEAERLGGHRVSGMREKFGTTMESTAEVWIKLDSPKGWEFIETDNEFRRVLEGGQWETFSPVTKAYIKPKFERSAADRELVNIITEELDRIVPQKVAIQEADRIKASGAMGNKRPIEPNAMYIQYRETYPIILYSLEGPDPLGSARHEAIHHLRNYGFFNKNEWGMLEKAVGEQGWIEQFNINSRYPHGDIALKHEEAIADAYKAWENGKIGKALTPEIVTLFERMKQFFEAIRKRLGEMLGKDPTWEDIFAKVSTGEVGAREGTGARSPHAFDERASAPDGPNLKPAIIEEDGSIRVGKAGQMHMEIKANNPKESGWVDVQGNFLNREQAIAHLEQYHNRGAEYLEEQAEQGRNATLEEMDEQNRNATPQDIAYDFYVVVGRNNHRGALKLFDEDISQELMRDDPRFVKAREIILNNLDSLDERAQVPDEPPADSSRVFERAAALGVTKENFARLDKLQQQKFLEDLEASQRRVDAAQRKVQTKEWKANRAELRKSVVDEIDQRPDIAADNYFADGMLYGNKIESHEKLGTDFLTPEQRAALPRDYYRKDGVHPDDLAPLFGYPNGAALVDNLSQLSTVRRTSGMRPIEFKRRMIDIETDRQMHLRYGVLEDNILDAVKEQVASETQLSILHEETLFYAEKANMSVLDKDQLVASVKEEFEKSSMSSVSSDRYMAAAGRAGRMAETALLKQDYEAYVREKQKQFYSMVLAKESIGVEAQVAKFEKLSKRLAPREVKAVEPEYLDFIHGLLGEATVPIKRSMDEVAQSKEYYGHPDLATFVAAKDLEGWGLGEVISEALQNGQVKPLDQMTVGEMREFMDAVTSLNHVGRAVRKIEIAGEKKEFADFRAEVIANIEQLPERSRKSNEKKGLWLYRIDAELTRMEEVTKDLDLRKELGPLHQAVIEPMMRSKAKEFDLMTDLSKHFQETRGSFNRKWRKSLDDTIPQNILFDPYTKADYDMTRANLIQVMLNWGNRSNIGKFVNGAAMAKFGRRLTKEEFPMYEAQIKALIDRHATPEDWQFVQRMWEPFKGWQEQMQDVSRSTSGVAPKLIPITNVETPHGTFPGGYWPVKYDRLGSNAAVVEDRKPAQEGVFGADYFRAATAKGYLKERTGYVDFVDISTSLEQAAGTMQQTIHDIAFRDSLIQAGRVFYDKGIRAAIRRHYGVEYEKQLVPWLRRIAHQFSTDDTSIAGYNDFMRRVRINLVGHALPLNLKVILSPDIGTPLTGAKVAGQTLGRMLQAPLPDAWANFRANRQANVKLAMEKSDEIRHLVYNMDRDFRESLDRVTLDPTVGDLQKKAVQWGFIPIARVSQEFRISTFVDQYQKALGRGRTEQEAALIADSFVRERHGAASVVDLPSIMQSNEGMKMLTMFYGYFNTMYNWQRQLPGNVRRGEAKEFAVNGLGSVVVGAAFGAVLFNKRKEDDSWFKIIGKALLLQPLGTIPIVREAAAYGFEGYHPRTPFASLLGAAGSIYTDAKKFAKGQRVEKPITHVANVIGLTTGLPLAQVGRTAQFGTDVALGRQRPKNIGEWARGIITGEAKLKR